MRSSRVVEEVRHLAVRCKMIGLASQTIHDRHGEGWHDCSQLLSAPLHGDHAGTVRIVENALGQDNDRAHLRLSRLSRSTQQDKSLHLKVQASRRRRQVERNVILLYYLWDCSKHRQAAVENAASQIVRP